MPYRIVDAISYAVQQSVDNGAHGSERIPGPPAAAKASSPMKKSRSSVPRFAARFPPGPAPPVKKVGLFATAGLPDPEPPAPPGPPLVAMAVGKTKEGESLPAKPLVSVSLGDWN